MRYLSQVIGLVAVLAVPPTGVHAQVADAALGSAYLIQLGLGRADYSLSAERDLHEGVVSGYTKMGLRIPAQRLFPAAVTVGVDVLRSVSEKRAVGFGVHYGGTRAWTLYGDYGGTLDVASAVDVVSAEMISRYVFTSLRGVVRPFLGVRGGGVLGTRRIREEIDLGDLGEGALKMRARGVGFAAEALGGVDVVAGPVVVTARAGYRYSRVPWLWGRIHRDGEEVRSGRLHRSLELSGLVGAVSIGLPLR